MTVGELIVELEKVDEQSLEVLTEGCDCYGEACRVVSLNLMERCVMISRTQQDG